MGVIGAAAGTGVGGGVTGPTGATGAAVKAGLGLGLIEGTVGAAGISGSPIGAALVELGVMSKDGVGGVGGVGAGTEAGVDRGGNGEIGAAGVLTEGMLGTFGVMSVRSGVLITGSGGKPV